MVLPEDCWGGWCSEGDPTGCVPSPSCFLTFIDLQAWSFQFLSSKSLSSLWFLCKQTKLYSSVEPSPGFTPG